MFFWIPFLLLSILMAFWVASFFVKFPLFTLTDEEVWQLKIARKIMQLKIARKRLQRKHYPFLCYYVGTTLKIKIRKALHPYPTLSSYMRHPRAKCKYQLRIDWIDKLLEYNNAN